VSLRWRRSSVYFEVSNIDTLPSPARLEPAHQDRTYYSTGGSSNNNNFVLRRMHRWKVGALPGLSVQPNTPASGYEANTSNGTSMYQPDLSRALSNKLAAALFLGSRAGHPTSLTCQEGHLDTSKKSMVWPQPTAQVQHMRMQCHRPPTSGASYIQHSDAEENPGQTSHFRCSAWPRQPRRSLLHLVYRLHKRSHSILADLRVRKSLLAWFQVCRSASSVNPPCCCRCAAQPPSGGPAGRHREGVCGVWVGWGVFPRVATSTSNP
jgi:hypothetical protein